MIRSPTLVSNSTFTSASPSASAAAAASAAHRQPRQPERSNSTATTTTSSHSNPNLADEPDSWARQQLNDAISVLKATHAELIAAVQALPLVVVPSPQPQPGTQIPQVVPPPPKEQTTSTSSSSSSSTPPPLQTTDLDPPRSSYPSYPYPASSSPPGSPTGALNRSFAYQRTLGHTRNAPSRATTIASSSRASFVSAVEWNQPEASGGGAGGGSEYWYDAVPVPGEFVLDDEDGEGARGGRRRSSSSSSSSSVREASPPLTKPDHHDDDDERAAPSEHLLERRRSSSSSNTVTRSGLEDDDEEEEEAVEANIVAEDDDEDSGDDDEADGAGSSSVHHPSSPGVPTAATTEAGTEPTTAAAAAVVAAAVQRRKVLPHPVAGDEFSMLGMLRKNVGKVRLAFFLLHGPPLISPSVSVSRKSGPSQVQWPKLTRKSLYVPPPQNKTGPLDHLVPRDDERAPLGSATPRRGTRVLGLARPRRGGAERVARTPHVCRRVCGQWSGREQVPQFEEAVVSGRLGGLSPSAVTFLR